MTRAPLLLFLFSLCGPGCAPPPPEAAFSAETPTSGEAPLRVRFADASRGSPTAWSWDFGDGRRSDLPAPTHVYREPGTYEVSLTARGPGGETTARRPGLVTVRGSAPEENVLLIVADDISACEIECYGLDPGLPPGLTPTITALAERGVLFESAWTNPFCSPSRAQLLTGRHAFRTCVGNQIESADVGLSSDEITLNEALVQYADAAYETAALGKWHLEPLQSDWPCAPTDKHGFDFFDGNLFQVLRYDAWLHVVCPNPDIDGPWRDPDLRGSASPIADYMPAYVVDRAIDWIASRAGPWFCYLAPQAPYSYQHVPPLELQDFVEGTPFDACDHFSRECYLAALQAFDKKLADLLASLGPDWEEDTTIVFVSDNGTPKGLVGYNVPGHGKGSLYEGGLHVPLIVAGRAVAPEMRGTRRTELVGSTDVYRTVLELAGATDVPAVAGQDSVSFLPLLRTPSAKGERSFLYAEYFYPNAPARPFEIHFAAARDERFKLVWNVTEDRPHELFDLREDPLELANLLANGAPAPDSPAGRALESLAAAIHATLAG